MVDIVMKRAIYPGSFNPWHAGHEDILKNTLKVFDQVVIAIGVNPQKDTNFGINDNDALFRIPESIRDDKRINVITFDGLLIDAITDNNCNAVVRGLRNGVDLEYEKVQQYWNEDLGIKVPTICFISDRELVHISSSAIRAVAKFKK